MSRDNFSIPGYDAWKTRAPEDEPGYWDDKEPEEDADLGITNARVATIDAPDHAADCQCHECVLPF